MHFELMASMMCADYGNLEREVSIWTKAASIPFISISWMAATSLISPCL